MISGQRTRIPSHVRLGGMVAAARNPITLAEAILYDEATRHTPTQHHLLVAILRFAPFLINDYSECSPAAGHALHENGHYQSAVLPTYWTVFNDCQRSVVVRIGQVTIDKPDNEVLQVLVIFRQYMGEKERRSLAGFEQRQKLVHIVSKVANHPVRRILAREFLSQMELITRQPSTREHITPMTPEARYSCLCYHQNHFPSF